MMRDVLDLRRVVLSVHPRPSMVERLYAMRAYRSTPFCDRGVIHGSRQPTAMDHTLARGVAMICADHSVTPMCGCGGPATSEATEQLELAPIYARRPRLFLRGALHTAPSLSIYRRSEPIETRGDP
jgi:hypothetical protein